MAKSNVADRVAIIATVAVLEKFISNYPHGISPELDEACAEAMDVASMLRQIHNRNEQLMQLMVEALIEAVHSCSCMLGERDSGHRPGCYVPRAQDAIDNALRAAEDEWNGT